MKADYTSDSLRIAEANRDGTVVRTWVFQHVLLCEVTGTDSLNYTDNEPRKLVCRFRSDFWDESFA